MPLKLVTLDLNYLKLRHQLEHAGYRLQKPASIQQQAVAADVTQAVCAICNNRLHYQYWTTGDHHRELAVCMECYQARTIPFS